MRIFGKGFNFNQDGPGNRLVYHLQGCNMRCPWCSNPEGMSSFGGIEYSIEEISRECARSQAMFFSGGGVTFTGGEATLCCGELIQLLIRLKARGIHTAIETNGTSPRLAEIAKHVDYLIMDIKHYDADAHLKYTAVPITTVRKNYEDLCRSGRQLHIRIPLINGVNSDNPEKFAEYLASCRSDSAVYEILPYHEYGKDKWKTEYTITNGFVSRDQVAELDRALKERGLKTITT